MDGFLIVNKHLEVTSFDIVYKIKKILNEKIGHTGTLDPLASRSASNTCWKRNTMRQIFKQ